MAPLKYLSISLCLTRACNCVIKLLEKRNGYDDKTKAWSWTDLAYLMKVRSECEWFAPFFCITLMISNYTFTFTYHDSIYKTVPTYIYVREIWLVFVSNLQIMNCNWIEVVYASLAWLSLVLAISLSYCTGACKAFALEPIQLPLFWEDSIAQMRRIIVLIFFKKYYNSNFHWYMQYFICFSLS